MLNQQTIAAAYPLTEQLDAAKLFVEAVPGTPLHHLTNATRATSAMAWKNDDGTVMIDLYEIERMANAPAPGFEKSVHDFVIDDLVEPAAAVVRRTLAVARTQVAPMISDLVDMVTLRMNSATPSVINQVEIRTKDNISALYNPALSGLLEKYQLTPPDEPVINMALPRLTIGEILPLMETGVNSLDSDIAEWAAGISPYELEGLWDSFFCALTPRDNPNDNSLTSYEGVRFSSLIGGWEAAPLAIFLLSRHLLDNDKVLDNTQMGLEPYKKTLQSYMEQSGMRLNRQIEKNNASIKNGVLVTSISGSVINVNTPVYNTWLEEGGDNDILYGMLSSSRQAFTVQLINSRADEYRELWTRYVAFTTSADSNRRFTYLREQLVLSFENILNTPHDGQSALDVKTIFETMKRFKDELGKVSMAETENLYKLCLKLVCRSRFHTTAAERILTKMEEVAKGNPKLSTREAGAIAVIDYICEFVSQQMRLVAV